MPQWRPMAATTLIGSMPHGHSKAAIELIFREIPDIPVWPQLSTNPDEQMTVQYLEGLPGVRVEKGRTLVDLESSAYERELYEFYEAYLELEAGRQEIDSSRFRMGPATGATFFEFLRHLERVPASFRAVKGQIIGPFTLLSVLKDSQDRSLLYHEPFQDVVAKHLAMKARWQIERLKTFGRPVLIFLDEPGLAGFGSSAFIAVSAELVQRLLGEVIQGIHDAGGLAGIHVCANTDWQLIFDTEVDVINFDAYGYFEKFLLYREPFLRFMADGRSIAWGLVPTHDARVIDRESAEHLADLWFSSISRLLPSPEAVSQLLAQSLFTPSCGCGSLTETTTERVLQLTREVGTIMQSRL